jgi:hypothetical protein
MPPRGIVLNMFNSRNRIRRRRGRALATRGLAALSLIGACHDSATGPKASAGPACGDGSTVRLSPNQARTIPCGGDGKLITLSAGAKYLIVPQFATGTPSAGVANVAVAYQIGSPATTLSVGSSTSLVPSASTSAKSAELVPLQRRFHDALRENARHEATSASWYSAAPLTRAASRSVSLALPDVGSLRDFHVLVGGLQTFSSATISARLRYSGNNILLYVDTLAPGNGFTAAQLQSFGQYFDQTLYQIDVGAFGAPSDVDANGHVIMLLSPSVNQLTSAADCRTGGYIAGYFNGSDLGTSATSNRGEVFYSVVPDPNGALSCAHTVTNLLASVPATFLHELQHLISFSQHVVAQGGPPEEGWLDEGLSIRAEELGSEYFEAKFPPPSGRANASQIFPDSSQGFVNGFLSDSYAYLLRTDTAAVTLHSDSDDGLAWRGSDWLLIHWLGDLKGKGVFTSLVRTRNTGVANIAAVTGEPFASLFGDFSVALWTDSLVGVPRASIPARNRFQSRNLRQLYQRLFDTNAGSSSVPRAFPIVPTTLTANIVTATMVPGTMAFYILDMTGATADRSIQFATPAGAAFATNLHAQVSVYRLPN